MLVSGAGWCGVRPAGGGAGVGGGASGGPALPAATTSATAASPGMSTLLSLLSRPDLCWCRAARPPAANTHPPLLSSPPLDPPRKPEDVSHLRQAKSR